MNRVFIGALCLSLGCEAPPTVLGVGPPPAPPCSFSWTFESGSQGWLAVPLVNGAANPWQHGVSDNPGCHEGTQCFATSLLDGYPGCAAAALVSPQLNLLGCQGSATLSFWHWRDFNNPGDVSSPPDGAFVQLSRDDGASWMDLPSPTVDPYNGRLSADPKKCDPPEIVSAYVAHDGWGSRNASGWLHPQFALPDLATAGPVRLRFVFGSSGNRDARGWIIDDVRVVMTP